ncbi:DsrE family protein [Pseudohoeflea coraliihabitans]|uniref:DsrE family protein n=1 Tax=Pseudohoeflea coraliihabitans TaxID=2860393 RepID=A0ABS6WS19_9HYPH|nr:DsrE family protein [Pseudohoeflea sp. DP4N28-3]MBW3098448.1 DsrE family protein [Pseudohoeflea sp. DP4N28-3]
MIRSLAAAAFFAVVAFALAPALAAESAHKLAIHVDESDPAIMNMALNNAANVRAYYDEKGEDVTIEIVAYGPGLKMYTADSPVADRISAMSLEDENLSFSACGNTLAGMEKKKGGKVALLDEATIVPSGVVRLMELQEDGYSYVRP